MMMDAQQASALGQMDHMKGGGAPLHGLYGQHPSPQPNLLNAYYNPQMGAVVHPSMNHPSVLHSALASPQSDSDKVDD